MYRTADDATLWARWDGPIYAPRGLKMRWLHLYSNAADRSRQDDRAGEAETVPLRPIRPAVFARWAEKYATATAGKGDEATHLVDVSTLADEGSAP